MSELEQNLIKVGMPPEHAALVMSQLPPSEAELLASYSMMELSGKLPALNGRFVSKPQPAAKKSLSLPKSKLSIPDPNGLSNTPQPESQLKSTKPGGSLMKGMEEAPDAAFVPTMQFKRSSLPKSAVDTNTSTQTGLNKPNTGVTPLPGTLAPPSSGLAVPGSGVTPPPGSLTPPSVAAAPSGGLSAPGSLTPPGSSLTPPSGGLSAPGSLTPPGSGLTPPNGGLSAPGSGLTPPSGGLSAPGSGLTPPGGNLAPPPALGGLKPAGNLAPPPSLGAAVTPLTPPSFAASESATPLDQDPQDAVKTSVGIESPSTEPNTDAKVSEEEVKVSAKVDFAEMSTAKKSGKPKGMILIIAGAALLVIALAAFFMGGSSEEEVASETPKVEESTKENTGEETSPDVAVEVIEEIPDDVEQVIYHDLTLPAERAWQINLKQAIEIQLEKALTSESTIEFWVAFERDEVTKDIPVVSLKNGETTVLELSLTNKSKMKISADLITQETTKPLRLNGSQYHVAIVYINSALSLFINGRLVSSDELKNFRYDHITLGSKDTGMIQFDEVLVADNVYYDPEAPDRFLPERSFSRNENSVLYIPAELVEKDKLDIYHMSKIEKVSLLDESWLHASASINSVTALLTHMANEPETEPEFEGGDDEVPELE